MQIREAAEASGLSADTIRYYEKIGIIRPISRDSGGQRQFSAEDIAWMGVLNCLRNTGMPMKALSRYAELVEAGDHTVSERKQILRDHAKLLAQRRAELDQCDALLAHKLEIYDEVEAGRGRPKSERLPPETAQAQQA